MMRIGYARNLARKLIKDLEVTAPPIPVEEAAKMAGLLVIPYDFPEEISAVLVSGKSEGKELLAIGVNQNHHEVRRRFSIAHELGHYILSHDDNLFLDFTDPALDHLSHSEAEQVFEQEANEFAAELLMPLEMIKRDYQQNPDPKALAKLYNVSEQALWIQLLKFKLV